MKTLEWRYSKFETLTPRELYAILNLRNKVFVVEQNCVYLDTDNKDLESFHLHGWDGNELAAYARIIPPGVAFAEASIGRVVTDPAYRHLGMGKTLMVNAIQKTFYQYPGHDIRIGAQLYLLAFYTSLGFRATGSQYMEDGIPHIEMTLPK